MVSIDLNGILHDVGTDIAAALEGDLANLNMADTAQQESDIEKQVVDAANKEERKDGKLILAEEIVEGRITWKAVKLYLDGLGGNHPFLFAAVWISGFMATHMAFSFGVWFLGYWGSQYENHHPEEVRVSL